MVYHLALNSEWEVKPFIGVDRFLSLKNIKTNLIVLFYDFNKEGLIQCRNKIRANFTENRIIHIISEDNDIDYQPYLLDEHIVDVLKNDSSLLENLWSRVVDIHKSHDFKAISDNLKKLNIRDRFLEDFVSASTNMYTVKKLMDKAKESDINVTIFGATGTGKEVVAKYIHHGSNRWDKEMVAVNVTAIPYELIESAFFGHEKGAFTGAVSRKIGFFEEASGGTLFLDEIGDMDIRMQAKLLRVLQEGEITRVGGSGRIAVDVRIISATNKDLKKEIEKGSFREDLYYRLLGMPISLPPLKDRGEDIILLSERFIYDFCKRNKKPLKYLSKSAEEALLKYSFPGNVRELRSMIELAIVMSDGKEIMPENLSIKNDYYGANFLDVERTLEEYELMIIQHFMKKYNNKVRQVASKLGIGKTKIYDLLNEGKIERV